MTDVHAQIQELKQQVDLLTSEMRVLKSFGGRLPRNAIVGKDYVAALFGCSEAAVVRGRCGTGCLRAVRLKPLGFIKSDVDDAHREFIKTPLMRAIDAERTATTIKRK